MEGTDHFVTTWRKSSYSGGNGGDCVAVGQTEHAVMVRDTKNPAGAVLTFDSAAWQQFAATIKTTKRA
jgi:hypothetical protein